MNRYDIGLNESNGFCYPKCVNDTKYYKSIVREWIYLETHLYHVMVCTVIGHEVLKHLLQLEEGEGEATWNQCRTKYESKGLKGTSDVWKFGMSSAVSKYGFWKSSLV